MLRFLIAGLVVAAGVPSAAAQSLPWQAKTTASPAPAPTQPLQMAAPPASTVPPASTTPTPTPPAVAASKPAPRKPLIPAKKLFGAAKSPAAMTTEAVGFYSKGCLAGGSAMAINGPNWQVMRLSRNRNWGHPALTSFLEKFAKDSASLDGWPGILVGDMSQPRGGPMLTGHASHQIGLDVDLWYDVMPARALTAAERETTSATNMLANVTSVNPSRFTQAHVKLLRRAASYPEVERILVHPAVKKALCEAAGEDREFLKKTRPFWGHDDHFHLRLACPPDSTHCERQTPTTGEDGCGKELDEWFALLTRKPQPPPVPPVPPPVPVKPKPPMTLDDMPVACKAVLSAAPARQVRR